MQDPLIYGDYRNALKDDEIRYYEELDDYDTIRDIFAEVRRSISKILNKLILCCLDFYGV